MSKHEVSIAGIAKRVLLLGLILPAFAFAGDSPGENDKEKRQLESANPANKPLWVSPDVQASITAAAMLRRGGEDSDFRAQCLSNTSDCLAEAGLATPDGYSIDLAEADDGDDAATIVDAKGNTTTFRLDRPAAEERPADDAGMSERGPGCSDYKVNYFIAYCWDASYSFGTPFKTNCLNSTTCSCKDNPNNWPCTDSACQDLAMPCAESY